MATEYNSNNGFQLISKYRSAIMGFSALWILFFHTWVPLIDNSPNVFVYCLYFSERVLQRIGFCGVDIFLLLSGLGLTYAIRKGSLLQFYFRRFKRILPVFFIVAIVRCFVEHWSLTTFLGNISGFNFYVHDIYSFLWFVTAIVTLYLLFPLYYKLFCKVKNKYLVTGIAILVWFIASVLVRDIMRLDLFAFTNRIPIFLVGIHFGYITQNNKQLVFKKWIYAVLTVVFAAGVILAFFYNFRGFSIILPQGNCFLPNFLIAISLPFLLAKLLDILDRKAPKAGKIFVAFFAFFGAFSFELYCVQDWLMDAIPYLVYFEWPGILINVTSFLIISAISWVLSVIIKYLWEFIDKISKRKNAKTENISK